MPIPLKLADRGRLLPAHLVEHVRERTQKLEHFYGGVRQCRVTVDGPGQHQLRDRVRVRIHLSVADAEIAINRQGGGDAALAVRAAFDAADRRLDEYARLRIRAGTGAKRRASRERATRSGRGI